MQVTKAQLIQARINGGVHIEFVSKENVIKGSNFEITHENHKHYFEVTDISIEGDDLSVKAKEVGYWAKKFDQKKDLDLRNLIGLPINSVEDQETVLKIREMSLWC